MSIFNKLELIREKSVETRRRILFLTLALSMIVVITIWISLLKLGADNDSKEEVAGPSPWDVLKNTFNTSRIQFEKNLPGEIYKRE